ncbi:MAG: LuxR C-terminal-related transcriptional regulator, partial [Solirubrobacteraceae bacterium]
ARAPALLGGSAVALRYAAALAGLPAEEAAAAGDTLAAAGIMLARLPLSFVHPIVRAAVYGEIPAGRRADAHARAAHMLATEDEPPERVAAHLLATEPAGDRWTCERLAQAAEQALARGAPEAAITALRRALEEPPAAPERPAMLIALGTAEMLALDTEPAIEHLRRGIETTPDPNAQLRASLLLAGGLAAASRVADSVELLDRVLEQAARADPALAGHVEGQLVNIARLQPETRRRVAARAARIRRRVDDGADVGGAELSAVATDMAMAGESAQRTAELALLAIDRSQGLSPTDIFSRYYPARCLTGADRLDDAQVFLDYLLAAAQAGGDDFARVTPLAYRSEMLLRRGELASAEADARAALELASSAWSVAVPAMASLLAATLLEYGDLEGAREVLDQAGIVGSADALPHTYPVAMGVHLRARVRLAGGDAAGAAEDLLECGRRLRDAGEPNPAYIDWRSCAARALGQLGDQDGARELVEEELTLARRFGAPRAIALALCARAALGEDEDEIDDLREAAEILDGSPAQLTRAHVLGDLGAAQLERGQRAEARETLHCAAEISQRCGATALTGRVMANLRRTGARPRRTARTGPDALTPAQRRVAHLAAQGLPNRDIALELVVTPRTVELHLSATYKKLGIRTRTELDVALAQPQHRPV